MSQLRDVRLASILSIFLVVALLTGCQRAGDLGSTGQPSPTEALPYPPETYLPSDTCAEASRLTFEVAAASQAPVLPEIDPNAPPVLGELGLGGANTLAAAMAPTDTFCSLAVSENAMQVIARAMRLVEQGKPEQARQVLEEWLALQNTLNISPPGPGNTAKLAKAAALAPLRSSARQGIRDLLNVAAADLAAGGDGSAYTQAANQAFRDLFAGEIGDAGLGDSLRLAEEAWRLGETELGDTAANRARNIMEEKLKADLEDFDPCTATKENVRDLLNSLAQAMLLGVKGSFEGDGQYYQAVMVKGQAAAQQLANRYAMQKSFPELTSPVPECTPGGHIEVRQTLAFASEPCITAIEFTLTWQGNSATLQGEGPFECQHVEENIGGSPASLHQISSLTLSFSGKATTGYPGTLEVTLTTAGEMLEFFSGFPKDSGQIFTEQTPFQVDAAGTFPLTFPFREYGKAQILNPETGQPAFEFILHLQGTP